MGDGTENNKGVMTLRHSPDILIRTTASVVLAVRDEPGISVLVFFFLLGSAVAQGELTGRTGNGHWDAAHWERRRVLAGRWHGATGGV